METIVLSVKLVNELLTYLNTRPHGEVRTIIDSIVEAGQEQPQKVADVGEKKQAIKPAKKAKAKTEEVVA